MRRRPDAFQGTASAGAPWELHTAVLGGDLAIVDSPNEPVGTVGEQGSLYVHRRTAGGWVLEQTLNLFDALAPQTGFSDFADQWALDDETLFVRYRDGSLPLSPRRVAVFEQISGVWQKTQTIDSDRAFFQEGLFGSFLAADEGRLVIASFAAVAFQGHAPGTLKSFERDALGFWVRTDLTTGANLQPARPRQVDLEGDRLAVVYDDLYVYERIPTGWGLEHQFDVSGLTSAGPAQSGASVSLAEDWVGYPTIRFFEWFEGEYKPFDVLRAGISAVAIDGANAFVAAPWLDPGSLVAADARLEVRRHDSRRLLGPDG